MELSPYIYLAIERDLDLQRMLNWVPDQYRPLTWESYGEAVRVTENAKCEEESAELIAKICALSKRITTIAYRDGLYVNGEGPGNRIETWGGNLRKGTSGKRFSRFLRRRLRKLANNGVVPATLKKAVSVYSLPDKVCTFVIEERGAIELDRLSGGMLPNEFISNCFVYGVNERSVMGGNGVERAGKVLIYKSLSEMEPHEIHGMDREIKFRISEILYGDITPEILFL